MSVGGVLVAFQVGCIAFISTPKWITGAAVPRMEELNAVDRQLLDEVFRVDSDLRFRSFPNVQEDNLVEDKVNSNSIKVEDQQVAPAKSIKNIKVTHLKEVEKKIVPENRMKKVKIISRKSPTVPTSHPDSKPVGIAKPPTNYKHTTPNYPGMFVSTFSILPIREPPHSYDTYSNYRSMANRSWFTPHYTDFGWHPPEFFDQYKRPFIAI